MHLVRISCLDGGIRVLSHKNGWRASLLSPPLVSLREIAEGICLMHAAGSFQKRF